MVNVSFGFLFDENKGSTFANSVEEQGIDDEAAHLNSAFLRKAVLLLRILYTSETADHAGLIALSIFQTRLRNGRRCIIEVLHA
jgi:hypothetical protein